MPRSDATATALPVRVAHLVSHPIQYFAPLYRELASRPEIDLTVYFYSDAPAGAFHDPGFARTIAWDVDLLGGYRYELLPSAARTAPSGRFLRRPNWDVIRAVGRGGFDVVWVHGYGQLTSWLAVLRARLSGARVLLREEQTLLTPRPWHRRALKAVALRALFRLTSCLYIGEANRRYLSHYGVPRERLFPARYCVDDAWFRRRAAELAPRRREQRAAFGVADGAPVVLFCGKLIEKKQPGLLLEAFARVRRRRPSWLLLAGDGPLREELERRVRGEAIPGVLFAGFLNQTELPGAYTAADVLVLPSAHDETWGLVVNEAMSFSLPLVVSDQVGCGPDLVRPGWNGFVFPHGDVDELARALEALVADAETRRLFGRRSAELVREYSVEACADDIVAACLSVVRSLPAAQAVAA